MLAAQPGRQSSGPCSSPNAIRADTRASKSTSTSARRAAPNARPPGKAEYRAQHVSQRAISEQRKKAALARIDTLLSLAKNLTLSQIGRQLGISKQRVHQLLRWRDKQLEKAKTG